MHQRHFVRYQPRTIGYACKGTISTDDRQIVISAIGPFIFQVKRIPEITVHDSQILLQNLCDILKIDRISGGIGEELDEVDIAKSIEILRKLSNAYKAPLSSTLAELENYRLELLDFAKKRKKQLENEEANVEKVNENFQSFMQPSYELMSDHMNEELVNLLELFYDRRVGIKSSLLTKMLIKHLEQSSEIILRKKDEDHINEFSILTKILRQTIVKQGELKQSLSESESLQNEIIELQDELDALGATDLALTFTSSEIFEYFLLGMRLLKFLLHDGNGNVQKRMMNYFLSTRDELFFFVLRIRIRENIELLSQQQSFTRKAVLTAGEKEALMFNPASHSIEILKDGRLKESKLIFRVVCHISNLDSTFM